MSDVTIGFVMAMLVVVVVSGIFTLMGATLTFPMILIWAVTGVIVRLVAQRIKRGTDLEEYVG